jgi:hypothetical protein
MNYPCTLSTHTTSIAYATQDSEVEGSEEEISETDDGAALLPPPSPTNLGGSRRIWKGGAAGVYARLPVCRLGRAGWPK